MNEWWASTGHLRYRNKSEFGRNVGVGHAAVVSWFNGRRSPQGTHRDRLYKATGLECFNPEAGWPSWALELRAKASLYIESLPLGPLSKKRQPVWFDRILSFLVRARITSPQAITPDTLIEKLIESRSFYKHPTQRRSALRFFGRLLVAQGFWSPEQTQDLEEILIRLYPARAGRKYPRQVQVVPLVNQLLFRCGLSHEQIQNLRVNQIEDAGIRLRSGPLIGFGEGWHQVSQPALAAWRAERRPQDYLFYQLRLGDYSRPVSRKWIASVSGVATEGKVRARRRRHFREDFRHSANLRRLHLHLRYYHGLSLAHCSWLLKKFAKEARKFPVPEPYLLAVLCVSRLLQATPTRAEGGKRCSFTWPALMGRYEVQVDWPTSFAQDLGDNRQTSEKTARRLFRLGLDYWREQLKIQRAMPVANRDRELFGRLTLTHVAVRDLETGVSWTAPLAQFRHRGRYLAMPLFEQLEGGPTNGQCKVCRHLERESIDAELRAALNVRRHEKGLKAIARKHGLPYNTLLRHTGRRTRRTAYQWKGRIRHRVDPVPGHMPLAPPAPIVHCSTSVGTLGGLALIIYSLYLLQLARSEGQDVVLSPPSVEQQVGLRLTDHELSLALWNLREAPQCQLVYDFHKVPSGFRILAAAIR